MCCLACIQISAKINRILQLILRKLPNKLGYELYFLELFDQKLGSHFAALLSVVKQSSQSFWSISFLFGFPKRGIVI